MAWKRTGYGVGAATVVGGGAFAWWMFTKPLTLWKRGVTGAISAVSITKFNQWVERALEKQEKYPDLKFFVKGNFPEARTMKVKLKKSARGDWVERNIVDVGLLNERLWGIMDDLGVPVKALALRTSYDKEAELLGAVSNQTLRTQTREDMLRLTTSSRVWPYAFLDPKKQAMIYAQSGTLSLDSGALIPKDKTMMRQSLETGRVDNQFIGGTGSHRLRGSKWIESVQEQAMRGSGWYDSVSKDMRVHGASGTLSLDSGALIPKDETKMRQ